MDADSTVRVHYDELVQAAAEIAFLDSGLTVCKQALRHKVIESEFLRKESTELRSLSEVRLSTTNLARERADKNEKLFLRSEKRRKRDFWIGIGIGVVGGILTQRAR